MKNINKIAIKISEKEAFFDLKNKLKKNFNIDKYILFGSYTKNNADNESDIDILILTNIKYTRIERHKITDIIFEINLKYNTNISSLVIDKNSWENGPISILPIKKEIIKDGVII